MNTLDRLEKLEEQSGNITEQDTILPGYQNPDTCVFCTNKDYDSIFYLVFRVAYNHKKGKDFEKQDKETCIHHTDDWLKHSLRIAGFIWSALTDYGNKSITSNEVMELFKNKQEREKILTKEYDKTKNFSSWIPLYDLNNERIKNGELEIFQDMEELETLAEINSKIIQNKIKIYYINAIEALRTLDDEETQ